MAALSFQRLRTSDEFSDLIVEIHGKQFHLHSVAMLASSDYFKALRRSNTRDSHHVCLDELPGGYQTMEIIADFCYCHPIEERLTPTNIGHVLCASSYLQMTGMGNLTEICRCKLNELCADSVCSCLEILENCGDVGPSAETEGVTATCIDEAVNHLGKLGKGEGRIQGSTSDAKKCKLSLGNLPFRWFVRIMEAMRARDCCDLLIIEFCGQYINMLMERSVSRQSLELSVSTASSCSNSSGEPPAKKVRGCTQFERPVAENTGASPQTVVSNQLASQSLGSAFKAVLRFILDCTSWPMALLPQWCTKVLQFTCEQRLDAKALLVDVCANPFIYNKLALKHVQELEPSALAEVAVQRGSSIEHNLNAFTNLLLVNQYLRYHSSRSSISASQFALLLKSSLWCRGDCDDSIFELLETMLENELSAEEEEEMIAQMDFTSLSQPVLERAARHEKIPKKVTQEAVLTVCSRLRGELQDTKDRHASRLESLKRSHREELKRAKQPLATLYANVHHCNQSGL